MFLYKLIRDCFCDPRALAFLLSTLSDFDLDFESDLDLYNKDVVSIIALDRGASTFYQCSRTAQPPTTLRCYPPSLDTCCSVRLDLSVCSLVA